MKKSIFHRVVTAALAAVMCFTTYVPTTVSAADDVDIHYIWNSEKNPYLSGSDKSPNESRCVEGEYIKDGEQIVKFYTNNGPVFCIEPSVNMLGSTSSNNVLTQSGFTTSSPENSSDAYWKKLKGMGKMTTFMGLAQYYGVAAHPTSDAYYAATQLLIWELILGYRGHNSIEDFENCTDWLYNDFTYPKNGYATEKEVSDAYFDIVNKISNHYNVPSGLYSTESAAKSHPYLMKYDPSASEYRTYITIDKSVVDNFELNNYSGLKSSIEDTIKNKFIYGTFNTDYGVRETKENNKVTYTIWSKNRPFSSNTVLCGKVETNHGNGIANTNPQLFTRSGYQTCLYDTTMESVTGYFAIATYNEPNFIVSKSYEKSGITISSNDLDNLIKETKFIIYTYIDNVKYYVIAEKDTEHSAYNFKRYTTKYDDSTGFKCLWKANNSTWQLWVYDLPTAKTGGRTYYIEEYDIPDGYTKQWQKITLPSPKESSYKTNAGDMYLSMINKYNVSDVDYTSTFLDKAVIANDYSYNMKFINDVDSLSNIYKNTKFVIGYWGMDDNNQPALRYFTKAYKTAEDAIWSNQDIKEYSFYDDVKNIKYKDNDGCYFLPFYVKTDSANKKSIQFDYDRTSLSIKDAYVFSVGSNYNGNINYVDICDYFGKIYLNLMPLEGDRPKNIFFIEVSGDDRFGYTYSGTTRTLNDVLKTSGITNKDNIDYVISGNNATISGNSENDNKNIKFSQNNVYPVVGLNVEGRSAYVENVEHHYDLRIYKKDSNTGEGLSGAVFGLYYENNDDYLIETATTDSNGYCNFLSSLSYNQDYYYKEIKAPDGYSLNNTFNKVNVSKTFNGASSSITNANSNYTKTVTFENQPKTGSIKIRKYDAINNFPIKDIKFDIKETGSTRVIATITTDENGIATYDNLDLGKLKSDGTFEKTYVVTEQEDDVYMTLDSSGTKINSYNVVFTKNTMTYSLDVPNRLQTVDLTVHKTDDSNNPIEGISFEIYPIDDVIIRGNTVQKANTLLGTITTDKNGYAKNTYTYKIEDVEFTKTIYLYPNHKYKLVEVENSKYEPIDPITFEVTSDKNDTLTVPYSIDVVNTEKGGNVVVHKSTEGMKNISGIKMILSGTSNDNTKVELSAITDKNGIARFDKVPDGTYTITEDKSTVPSAYLCADPKTITVTYNETTNVNFFNDEKEGSIDLQKRTKDMTNVDGIRFVLSGTSDSGRTINIEAVTDINGKAEFKNIPVGNYIITEDKDTVPSGYITASPRSVEVFYNKTTNMTFINDETSVIINKKSASTDKNIAGAKLVIIDAETNEVVESFISKTESHIISGKLIPGKEYILREIEAPKGYALAEDVRFTVSDTETIEVNMIDSELTSLPTAGGVGTTIFTIIGCMLMLSAFYIFSKSQNT